MKKLRLLNWMLIAFMAFQFSSCEDEPLEGQFPGNENNEPSGPAQFVALVDGVAFTAASTSGVYNDGALIITGFNASGDAINLALGTAGECTYDLGSITNPAQYVPNGDITNPFSSVNLAGGEGNLTVTSLNTTDNLVTGTFNFIGAREITDSSGNTTTATVNIQSGSFTNILFQVLSGEVVSADCSTIGGGDGGGDAGGDGGGEDDEPIMVDDFYALVDGAEHIDESFTITTNTVGDDMIFKLEALTGSGQLIRIDVPSTTGVGTFEMESDISDGTKLIGIYNPNTGQENLSSNPGTISFTQFNTVEGILEGTFSFTATDPLGQNPETFTVSEGAFVIYFEGVPDPTPTPFRAVIDGLEYLPDGADVTFTSEEINEVDVVTVSAAMADGQNMEIKFPRDIEVGVYMMSTEVINGDEKVGTYSPAGIETVYSSNPGMLTIQNYDAETGAINATFAFNAVDPSGVDPTIRTITEGEFNLNIL